MKRIMCAVVVAVSAAVFFPGPAGASRAHTRGLPACIATGFGCLPTHRPAPVVVVAPTFTG